MRFLLQRWWCHFFPALLLCFASCSGSNSTYLFSHAVRTWIHPSLLSDHISPDGQNASNPHVAIDPTGNAIITWSQSNGTHTQIFKSEYRNGVWTHPADLNDNISPDGQDAVAPQVVFDTHGNAILVWRQENALSHDQIFKSEYRGGVWTHPSSVNDHISPAGQSVYTFHVDCNPQGNVIITWYQSNGANQQIFKSEYRNGVWTHPADLNDNISPDGQDAFNPKAALDPQGNAIIIWNQSNGANQQIFKSEYRNGVWTHPADLNDNISPDASGAIATSVAFDPQGNAIITWYQSNGAHQQIFKSEYRGGVWTHPADLNDNISPDGQTAGLAVVSFDGQGNAIIAWQQHSGGVFQIFKSEYRNGAWIHPADLNDSISPNGGAATNVRVALNVWGNALIVWQQSNGVTTQIFKSTYFPVNE